jgi:alkanesulfonate monooxygenase SsuD/methylene tetrahydromethanopterin reductase-like flavin-dependent oxidoreductase (luciferase family)
MHVGYSPAFQNPGRRRSDLEVYQEELRLAEMAEPLGFDSVWVAEHHFTDYVMCPDVAQFLSYVAGQTSRVQLGSSVFVLPWHDPVRVAEQVAMLDNLSGGRALLGIGRGLGRVEFEGFRVPMEESRDRFLEAAQIILEGLERGWVELHGRHYDQPRRDIRPAPFKSFVGRTFAAAVSPESMPIMARLGVGLLVIPQKPWDVVRRDFEEYHQAWAAENGPDSTPPAPMSGGFVFVDESADRAEERARRYIGAYYRSVMEHYEMTAGHFAGTKGYEFYGHVTKYIDRHGEEGAVRDFVNLMPWGTPDQVLDKLGFIHDTIGNRGLLANFSYGGMPYEEAERSLRLFVDRVMPELKRLGTAQTVVGATS